MAAACDADLRRRCTALVEQSARGNACPCDMRNHANPAALVAACAPVRAAQAAFHESPARLECRTLLDCAACYDDVAARFAHCGCTPDRVAALVPGTWHDSGVRGVPVAPGSRAAALYEGQADVP